ncbi:MAG: FHA domain-containing protein [Myxococcaceae bacterium]|jgi:pSer/pThr/pTyr-binding forkhead associated (FHA) protein|nr:FHA domain-containing protein [Myxococcaceae bacterium]MCA3016324.1 FHA domain-containing protein [Myxococcaceae bacterium]
MANRPRVAVRVVRADGGPESVIPMRGDVMLCGRTGDLPIPDDPFVADTQMRLFFSGQRLAVEDVGGGNGVFTRLRSEREVAIGGEVRLGRQRLVVEPVPALAPGEDGATAWGSPDSGFRFRLVQLMEGGLRGSAYPLKEGDNQIGRELGDITFPTDGFVSGRHAVLHVAPERAVIRDLGSSNGTFLRLGAPAFVDNGDQFLIGRQLVRVEMT